MSEVRSLAAARADRDNDNTVVSPAECLEDVARSIRTGALDCNSALVLCLDTSRNGGSGWDIRFAASKLKCSEMLALLETAKIEILQSMGYIYDPDS